MLLSIFPSIAPTIPSGAPPKSCNVTKKGLKSSDSLYLMRQLNVALNRDIYRVKRVAFYSNLLLEDEVKKLISIYPRTELIIDESGRLLNTLQNNAQIDMYDENPIFIIDPYGRAVMYFSPGTDPKKILKDLKVLI